MGKLETGFIRATISRSTIGERWAQSLPLVAGLAALMLFGIVGAGRQPGGWAMDLRVFHAAGRTWLDGESPYDRVQSTSTSGGAREAGSFASPPVAAPLFMALGLMSEDAAMRLLRVLDLAAVGLLAWMAARMAREPVTQG